MDARADAVLDARASIQNEFSFRVFNHLGTNLQNRLIHAERFWLSCESDDDALGFVSDLYAAVQSLFGMALIGKLPPDVDDTELIKTAENKATAAITSSKHTLGSHARTYACTCCAHAPRHACVRVALCAWMLYIARRAHAAHGVRERGNIASINADAI